MLVLYEGGLDRRSDTDRRRVRCPQLRMLSLEVLELTKKFVVVAVGELWCVEYVVLVGSAVKRFPQLRGSFLRIAGAGCGFLLLRIHPIGLRLQCGR